MELYYYQIFTLTTLYFHIHTLNILFLPEHVLMIQEEENIKHRSNMVSYTSGKSLHKRSKLTFQ